MDPDYEPGLVSVIIPTYNRAQLLLEAMDSVWKQTYRPIEMLVVDDGSTDATPQTVRQWIDAHSANEQFTARYLEQENSGAPAARNLGLIASKGAYICYMDSDDLIHPQLLRTLIRAFESHTECTLAFADREKIFEGKHPGVSSEAQEYLERPEFDSLTTQRLTRGQRSYAQAVFRRSLCYQAGPWHEDLIRWQDIEYMCRVSCLRPYCLHVPISMYFLREHGRGRIEDLNGKREGVEGGLYALQKIEQTLFKMNIQNEEARHGVGRLYLETAKQAMKMDMPEAVMAALKGANRQQPNMRFSIQLKLFIILYSLIGTRAAAVLELYSSTTNSLVELYGRLRNICARLA